MWRYDPPTGNRIGKKTNFCRVSVSYMILRPLVHTISLTIFRFSNLSFVIIANNLEINFFPMKQGQSMAKVVCGIYSFLTIMAICIRSFLLLNHVRINSRRSNIWKGWFNHISKLLFDLLSFVTMWVYFFTISDFGNSYFRINKGIILL